MKPEQIAKVCHEANRAYCECLEDMSQKPWDEADEWQKESTIRGVEFRIKNPGLSARAQHEAWLEDKIEKGWKVGEVKDVVKKEHPCMVAYEQLSRAQQAQDALFMAIVNALQ